MNTLTEKERRAITHFAESNYDPKRLMLSGEFSKITEAFNDGLFAGILKGAKFLAELRKEEAKDVDIDSLAEWEYTMELQNLNDRLGANEAFKEGIIVGIKAGMRVKEEAPSEEFTEQLRHILIMHGMEGMDNISESISEIAKLLTPDVKHGKSNFMDVMRIFRDYFSELDGKDSWSINSSDINAFIQKIDNATRSNVNADTVTKKEMFEFAKYYLKNGITEFMQSVPLLEAYKQFQNAEPK